jgi:hypothetical protein
MESSFSNSVSRKAFPPIVMLPLKSIFARIVKFAYWNRFVEWGYLSTIQQAGIDARLTIQQPGIDVPSTIQQPDIIKNKCIVNFNSIINISLIKRTSYFCMAIIWWTSRADALYTFKTYVYQKIWLS